MNKGTKQVIITVDRTPQGYTPNAVYDGDLDLGDYNLIDEVARFQKIGEEALNRDKTKNHFKTIMEVGIYEFDPLGIKRLMRYRQ